MVFPCFFLACEWWEPLEQCQYLLFENGISFFFRLVMGPSLENNANILYLKTECPWCFGLVMGTFGKYCQYLLFENGISVFFWASDGNLWKIMPISSIWKRDFRNFLGLWWEPLKNNANIFYLKTGFPSFFGLVMGTFRKQCQYLLFENGISVVFWACDGDLWKIMSISSIWKWNFRVFFFGLWVMGTSGKQCQYLLFENGISLFFGLVMGPSGK